MCFYLTLEFLIYLDLFSVFVAIKNHPWWICHECVQFQTEIWKISPCGSRSPNNAELGHFTLLFCSGRQGNVPRIITHVHSQCFCSLKLLFGDALVAVANRRVLRKVSNVCCVTVSGYKSGVTLQNQTHSLRTLYRRTVNKTTWSNTELFYFSAEK